MDENIYGILYLTDCPAIPNFHAGALENREFSRSVSIYVTRACNLRCKTCYINAGKPLKNELRIEDYKKIFGEIKELKIPMVYILGGEPMIRNDIFEIITMAKENDLYVSMSSNGYFINKEMAFKLESSGLDQTQISIDAADEKTNDYIRGKGSFKRAVEAVENLKNAGIKVSIAYTITSFYSNVKEMIYLAESENVDVMNISVAEPFGRAIVNNAIPGLEQVRTAINDLKKIKTKLKITSNGFRFYMDTDAYFEARKIVPENYKSCPAGINRFVIDANGDVYGCELLMQKEFREGNVKEKSLIEIWEHGFNKFRERQLPEDCNHCPYRDLCQGGCPARAYLKGDLNKKDILCKLEFKGE